MTRLNSLVVSFCVAVLTSAAPGGVTEETYKLASVDGAAGDEFGHAVAVAGGIIAAGSPNDDDQGAVYLFDAITGAQIAKLVAIDGEANDLFGFSVAIADGIVAVGAPGHDDAGADAGAAYLFDASTGTQLTKLIPDDPAAGDEFGNSVAADDGIVAVGAWRADEFGEGSGAAYLFESSSGIQIDKLLPESGNDHQTFGVSIAMDDGIVAVGARTYFVLGEGYTFAKVYLYDASTGTQLHRLQAEIENYNGDLGGHFGDAVDIENGLVAVGAPFRSIFFDFSGAAYLFDASTGEQLHFLFPADGHDRDNFGASVGIDNGILATGAPGDDDSASAAGSAYLFDATTGTLIDKLLASDGDVFDELGTAIAIDNDIVVIGAMGDDDHGEHSGSVYVFGDGDGVCPEDLDESGAVDVSDLLTLLSGWGGPDGDVNGDETTDIADLLLLLAAWGTC